MSVTFCSACKLSTENEPIALHSDGTIVHEKCVKVAEEAIQAANADRTCTKCAQVITIYDEITYSDEGGLWHVLCLIQAK